MEALYLITHRFKSDYSPSQYLNILQIGQIFISDQETLFEKEEEEKDFALLQILFVPQ